MGSVDREASEEMTVELRPEEQEMSLLIRRDMGKGKSGLKGFGGGKGLSALASVAEPGMRRRPWLASQAESRQCRASLEGERHCMNNWCSTGE